MNHWEVVVWSAKQGPHGHEFTIRVDSDFLAAAGAADFSRQSAQREVTRLAKEAGLQVPIGAKLLVFGEYGVEGINHPQNSGCGLYLEATETGGIVRSHNTDRSDQQAFLMAVWVWWIHVVMPGLLG